MESFDTRFHGACIPQELFVTNWEAYKALRDVKTKNAAGPDVFPSVVLKLFTFEHAPVVADLYNSDQRFVRASFLLFSRAR